MFAGQIGRATILAASALRAGVGIKNLLPGEFIQLGHTEGFLILNITNRFHISGRLQRREEMVGRCGNDMHQTGVWNVSNKTECNKCVRPPTDGMPGFGCFNIQAGNHIGQGPADK